MIKIGDNRIKILVENMYIIMQTTEEPKTIIELYRLSPYKPFNTLNGRIYNRIKQLFSVINDIDEVVIGKSIKYKVKYVISAVKETIVSFLADKYKINHDLLKGKLYYTRDFKILNYKSIVRDINITEKDYKKLLSEISANTNMIGNVLQIPGTFSVKGKCLIYEG